MPEGNLDQDPHEWAQRMFEDEYCAECGGDENDHDIIPVNGNWFARCKPLRKVRATVTVEVDIGHRVDPERAREVIAAYAEHGSLIEGVYAAFEGADVLISEARVVPADNGDSVKPHPRMPRDVADSEWRAISESLPHGAWIEPANDDTWVVSHPEGAEVDFTDLDKAVRYAKAHAMPPVPEDFPVQPIDKEDIGEAEEPTQCGTCGRWWDDGVVTAWTPTPAARCPFEYFHPDPDLADD